jgi:hypothetical protein
MTHTIEPIIPGMICILITGIVYFLPFLIALMRHHKQPFAVFLLNLFAGWTCIGWLASIVWAAMGRTPGIGDSNETR